MNKSEVRKQLRAARAGELVRAIQPRAEWLERLAPGLVVASYHPVGSEADPGLIAAVARAAGCAIALPHVVDRETPLRFLGWDGTPLTSGPFGLSQPELQAPEVTPDIILAPLLGFDRHGNRLGQGAGHYDRAFTAHPSAWRVGVALAVQEVPQLIPDSWDVPLHAVITDREWIAIMDQSS